MKRRLLLVTVIAAATLVSLAGPASAGGWAVTTLDSLPGGVTPGRATPIGYTIRQHGVTLVELDGTALIVTAADGQTVRFPGAPDGRPGHHVAVVTVPDAGRYSLRVEQGWFGPQDLGHLDVGASAMAPVAPPAPSSPSSGRWPWPVRGLLVVATAVAVAILGGELAVARARRRRESDLAGAA